MFFIVAVHIFILLVILRLRKAVDFVVCVVVDVVVVFNGLIIFCWGQLNDNLRILKATVEFLWWVGSGGVVCTVIFVSNTTTVLRLCYGCVVLLLGL